jgi:hypothetical protein
MSANDLQMPASRCEAMQVIYEFNWRQNMKLSTPKQLTFWIAVALAVLGVIAKLIPTVAKLGLSGWLVLIAFVVLAAGNVVEGL